MSLKLYNTQTGKKEALRDPGDKPLKMYVCGITPYDKVHLGHARCYVTFDILKRYLTYKGYRVRYIQNFTDIDDKIIARSRSIGKIPQQLAQENIEHYKKQVEVLGIQHPDEYVTVTDNIPLIIKLIQKLVEKNHAYQSEGDVFFEIKSFPDYGKLSHRNIDELKQGARIEINTAKKNPLDFALWKSAKADEPSWDSPWGKGRPGWHIECSALSMARLGETLDIHGGGQDLLFPHHENEIAQSESATGKPFVKLWMHNGFVTLNQQKMSKSLGNFFTLEDIFKKFNPMAVRLFLLSQHYRSPLDFSDSKLDEFTKSLKHLRDSLARIQSPKTGSQSTITSNENRKKIESFESAFIKAMDDDLNTAQGLGIVFNMVNFMNELTAVKNVDAQSLQFGVKKIKLILEDILGIAAAPSPAQSQDEDMITELIKERTDARKQKNWKESDRIRDKLNRMGVTLEDTPSGTRWWRR